jgi:hypothetical protein
MAGMVSGFFFFLRGLMAGRPDQVMIMGLRQKPTKEANLPRTFFWPIGNPVFDCTSYWRMMAAG